jgi:hypothetical protein
MTVHRVRLYHSTTGAQDYHDWLSQWLNNVDAALQSEVDNEPPTLREQVDGDGEWYQGDLAFTWDEGKANILDNLDIYAANNCDWHRIGYHECSHDEDNPAPCGWDEQPRENGSVPAYIPDMEPEQS